MNFSFKSHLLISELKFIAAHVSRRTVMWCVVDGTKLRLYARDGLFTVETMVPLLVEVDGLISFGVSARYMLAAAQANRKPIVDMTLDGVVRLGSWALNAFYGPSPKWIFRENQLTTLATVSRYSLQTVLETAKRFASQDTISESYQRGILLGVERHGVKARSAGFAHMFEHALIGQPFNETLELFVPTTSASAISEISPAPSGHVEIGISLGESVFRCGPRSVRIASTPHRLIPSIGVFLQKQAYAPMFAVSVDTFQRALMRISAIRGGASRKVTIATSNGTLNIAASWQAVYEINKTFVQDELMTEADEQMSAQCWQESSVSLDGEAVLKFVRDIQRQTLVVHTSTKKNMPIVFDVSGQRFALAPMF